MLQLVQPNSPEQWLEARRLVQEYAASLDFDLCFQGFERELQNLETEYGHPDGYFALAAWDRAFVGCGGLRRFSSWECEMKRVYVAPSHRGRGIGQGLTVALISHARRLGYKSMLLDTLSSMTAAQRIYFALGFTPTEPYRANPVPGATFLKLQL